MSFDQAFDVSGGSTALSTLRHVSGECFTRSQRALTKLALAKRDQLDKGVVVPVQASITHIHNLLDDHSEFRLISTTLSVDETDVEAKDPTEVNLEDFEWDDDDGDGDEDQPASKQKKQQSTPASNAAVQVRCGSDGRLVWGLCRLLFAFWFVCQHCTVVFLLTCVCASACFW